MAQQEDFGMFGPMPWQVAEMQKRQGMQDDMRYAQMDPMQGSVFMSAQAGRNLGGAITGTARQLGVPVAGNEAMEQAEKLQTINRELQNSGVDPTDPEKYLSALGEKLARAGLTSEAMKVAQALQAHRDKQASLDVKKYEADTARMRADAYKTGKMRPENEDIYKNLRIFDTKSVAEWEKSQTPENPRGDISLLKRWEDQDLDDLGQNAQGEVIWKNKQGQMFKRTEAGLVPTLDKIVKQKGVHGDTNNNINVAPPSVKFTNVQEAPKEGVSQAGSNMMGSAGGDALKKHTEAMAAIDETLPHLASLEEVLKNKGPLITGTGADKRLALERARVTAGRMVGMDVDATALNNTDKLKQYTQIGVLPLLAKVGGSDTEEEQRNLRQAIANNTLTYEMVQHSVDLAKRKMSQVQKRQADWENVINNPNEKNPERFWAAGGRTTVTNKTPNVQDMPDIKSTYEVKGVPANVRPEAARPMPGAVAPQVIQSPPVVPVQAQQPPPQPQAPAAPQVPPPSPQAVAKGRAAGLTDQQIQAEWIRGYQEYLARKQQGQR